MCRNRGRHVAAQWQKSVSLTASEGSIPTWRNELIFTFFHSGSKAKTHPATQHATISKQSAESGEWRVLTLSFLYLPCCIRDIGWSWFYFYIILYSITLSNLLDLLKRKYIPTNKWTQTSFFLLYSNKYTYTYIKYIQTLQLK